MQRDKSIIWQSTAFAGLLVCAYLWRVLIVGEVPLFSDHANINDPAPSYVAFGPEGEMMRKMLQNGHSFLWTETRNLGTIPLYEEMPGSVLHPWTWVRSLFEFSWRWRINAIFEMLLIALAHLLMARRVFGFNWLASFVFTQLAVFNFFFMRNLNHVYLLVYMGGIWTFYFLLRGLSIKEQVSSRFWVGIFVGQSLGMIGGILAGFPEAAFPLFVLGVIVLVAAYFTIDKKLWWRNVMILSAATLVALMVSSFQIFAFFEGLAHLLEVSPDFRAGKGFATVPFWEMSKFVIWFERHGNNHVFYFTGALPLLLLVAAFVSRSWKSQSRWLYWAFGFSGVFFLFHVCGPIVPLQRFIASLYPFKMSNFYGFFPPMLILPVAWVVATWFQKMGSADPTVLEKRQWVWLAVIFLGILIPCSFLSIYFEQGPIPAKRYLVLLPLLLALYPLGRLLRRSLVERERRYHLAALIALIFLQNFIEMRNFKYMPAAKVEAIQFGPEDERLVQAICGDPRVAQYRFMWAEKVLRDFCVNQIDSPTSATPLVRNEKLKVSLFRRGMVLEEPLHDYSLAAVSVRWFGARDHEVELLEKWEVPFKTHFELLPGTQLVEIENTLPRAYLTRNCRWLPNEGLVQAAFAQRGYELGEALFVGPRPGNLSQSICSDKKTEIEPIWIEEEKGHLLKLAPVHGPGVVVLNDSFFEGWEVSDANVGSLEIAPVNLAFRGVFLPESKSYRLTFRYVPAWLNYAWGLTLIGIFIILAAYLFTVFEGESRARSRVRNLVQHPV